MIVKKIVVEEATHRRLVEAARTNRVKIQDLATVILEYGLAKLKAGKIEVRRPELVERKEVVA